MYIHLQGYLGLIIIILYRIYGIFIIYLFFHFFHFFKKTTSKTYIYKIQISTKYLYLLQKHQIKLIQLQSTNNHTLNSSYLYGSFIFFHKTNHFCPPFLLLFHISHYFKKTLVNKSQEHQCHETAISLHFKNQECNKHLKIGFWRNELSFEVVNFW